MPTLIELMKDPSVVVRDTTAWTVGRICDLLPEAAINELYLNPLLQCLIEGLGAEPRVASNVCWVKNALSFSLCKYLYFVVIDLDPLADGAGLVFRHSLVWLKLRTKLLMPLKIRRNPVLIACPLHLNSLYRSFWKPQTGRLGSRHSRELQRKI